MKWLERAACANIDPALFDHFVFPQAASAISVCNRCTVIEQCMNWVRPSKSYFDGVAAGVVWRNGYRVRPDNTTREDRFLRLRGENATDPTPIPELHGQGTLPFD